MYTLTGRETEVLVPRPVLGAVAPAATAEWRRVESFCGEDGGDGPVTLVGVYVAGQGLRRAHVVLDGR